MEVLERQFLNCLSRLQWALTDGCVLPGGGRTEVKCVQELLQRAEDLVGMKEVGKSRSHQFRTSPRELSWELVAHDNSCKNILLHPTELGHGSGPTSGPTTPGGSVPTDGIISHSKGLSWLGSHLSECRGRVYRGLAEGLKRYILTVEMNVRPGASIYEAQAAMERRVEGRGCGHDATSVFDVKESKCGSWMGAYHVTRLVFLTHTNFCA